MTEIIIETIEVNENGDYIIIDVDSSIIANFKEQLKEEV